MSVKHIGLVLDNLKDCSASLKLVAIILADHADSDGVCWPSYRKIAERANMHERSVQRHIHELQELQIITKIRSGSIISENGKRIRISNAYRMHAHILAGMGSKLSTDSLGITVRNVYLEHDTSVAGRVTPVSTKPSKKRNSNHHSFEPVDNSRDVVSLGDVFKLLSENS